MATAPDPLIGVCAPTTAGDGEPVGGCGSRLKVVVYEDASGDPCTMLACPKCDRTAWWPKFK